MLSTCDVTYKDMLSPDSYPIHPRLFGQGRFIPCLGPSYFLSRSSDCILETYKLLDGVRVHEHSLVTPVKAIRVWDWGLKTINDQIC